MIKDNLVVNEKIKPNSDFIKTLLDEFPEYFVGLEFDNNGDIINIGDFDLEKFKDSLKENNLKEIEEGYRLNFIGKDYAKKQAGEQASTVIVPDNDHNNKEINKDSKNLFFTGDNLEVLRHLQNNYRNSIDVIYIDPPYNTGQNDFVYPDSFDYSDEVLKTTFGLNDKELNRLKSIQGKSTHSAWLTFMYPRLYLAKNLLTDTGYIFVSIDDNENANLRLLLDEIFSESNFIGEIIRNTNSSKNQSSFISTSHDYCLVFAKNMSVLSEKHKGNKWQVKKNNVDEYKRRVTTMQNNGLSNDEITEELKMLTKYPRFIDFENYWYFDERGLYRKDNLGGVKNGNLTPIMNPLINDFDIIPPGGFRYNESRMEELIEEDRIHFHDNGSLPTLKRYLTDNEKQNPKAIMSDDQRPDDSLMKEYGTPFSNPKQLEFMKRIISISDPDSTVLDFFAGSATTAEAVLNLNLEENNNRKFIMVQLNEPTFEIIKGKETAKKGSEEAFKLGFKTIDEISRRRIEQASKKYIKENGLTLPEDYDAGFKHFRFVKPTISSITDLYMFDKDSGAFIDANGQVSVTGESGFDNMVDPFSSESLNIKGNSSGTDTIFTTWLVKDGYKFDQEIKVTYLDDYPINYVDESRIYLINRGWSSKQTKELINRIGTYQLNVQTIVLYGYSFDMETIRELELGLSQVERKINIVKRY